MAEDGPALAPTVSAIPSIPVTPATLPTPAIPARYRRAIEQALVHRRSALDAALSELAERPSALARAAALLVETLRRGNKVLAAGNGGSASTASHFACDLAKGTRTDGVSPFRVMPLTDNVPLLTAWANDTSYDRVYAEQLSALIRSGDVVVAISASGNSPNVVAAVELARLAGATVVALTGQTGGRLRRLAHITVRVPADPIEQVEDAHLAIAHSLCVALRQRLHKLRFNEVAEPIGAVNEATVPAPRAELLRVDHALDSSVASS